MSGVLKEALQSNSGSDFVVSEECVVIRIRSPNNRALTGGHVECVRSLRNGGVVTVRAANKKFGLLNRVYCKRDILTWLQANSLAVGGPFLGTPEHWKRGCTGLTCIRCVTWPQASPPSFSSAAASPSFGGVRNALWHARHTPVAPGLTQTQGHAPWTDQAMATQRIRKAAREVLKKLEQQVRPLVHVAAGRGPGQVHVAAGLGLGPVHVAAGLGLGRLTRRGTAPIGRSGDAGGSRHDVPDGFVGVDPPVPRRQDRHEPERSRNGRVGAGTVQC